MSTDRERHRAADAAKRLEARSAATDQAPAAVKQGADHASNIPPAIPGPDVQHRSFMPAASDPFAEQVSESRDPLTMALATDEPAPPDALAVVPQSSDRQVPSDDWHRGYQEGYRASVVTVDEMRSEQEYQRGWSMGVIHLVLTEIARNPNGGDLIRRLATDGLAALADL